MGQKPTRPLNPGDHIYRSINGLPYYHHGIYVGDNMVIHLLNPHKNIDSSPPCPKCGYKPELSGGVYKTCLDCFLGNQQLHIVEYNDNLFPPQQVPIPAIPPERVVETATKLLENGFGPYNLIFNNCEHFAVYCKTGVNISMQVLTPGAGVGLLPVAWPLVPLIMGLINKLKKQHNIMGSEGVHGC